MRPGKTICLYNGTLFDGDQIIENGGVVFDNSSVLNIFSGLPPTAHASCYDVDGKLIMPGLVDLHSDALEKCIEMRPGVYFDSDFALQNLDRRLAACGITTICHAICFADDELGLRNADEAEKLVRHITEFNRSPMASIRHRIHARFEVGSVMSEPILSRLLSEDMIDLISFMDHTPGQGQFKALETYVDFYKESYQLTEDEVLDFAQRKQRNQKDNWRDLKRLADLARKKVVPILSHDDDTVLKVGLLETLGVSGSEFPVTLAAAEAAKAKQMMVFMGAPNLLRDKSSNGNLKASDTISRHMCDGLVSDYYPECLIQAPFIALNKVGLNVATALKMVTSQPGRCLNALPHAGWLTEGSPADLTVVDRSGPGPGPWVSVEQTWVGGSSVYQQHDRKRTNEKRTWGRTGSPKLHLPKTIKGWAVPGPDPESNPPVFPNAER